MDAGQQPGQQALPPDRPARLGPGGKPVDQPVAGHQQEDHRDPPDADQHAAGVERPPVKHLGEEQRRHAQIDHVGHDHRQAPRQGRGRVQPQGGRQVPPAGGPQEIQPDRHQQAAQQQFHGHEMQPQGQNVQPLEEPHRRRQRNRVNRRKIVHAVLLSRFIGSWLTDRRAAQTTRQSRPRLPGCCPSPRACAKEMHRMPAHATPGRMVSWLHINIIMQMNGPVGGASYTSPRFPRELSFPGARVTRPSDL